MPSAVLGKSGLATEKNGNHGLYLLLPPTLVSALPVSLTNSIPTQWTRGARLLIIVYNHTAAGQITVTGTAPLTVGAASETTAFNSGNLPVAQNPGDVVTYVTTTTFGAINASGVTLGTGLTGGTVVIYGMQAPSPVRMTPGEMKIGEKYGEYSPEQQRGSPSRNFYLLRTHSETDWEYQGDLYADRALFALTGGYNNNLTAATVPASPTSLLAATSVATSGNASLTTQPTAPGMILQLVLGGTAPATAGTVTVTGTNEFGEAYSETIIPSTKTQATYYSEGRFASVNANGVVFTAFGTGATVAINGVFCFTYAGNPDQTATGLDTFCLEQYDGQNSVIAPYCAVDEWGVEGGMEKEAKLTAKGPAQYAFVVGDPATTTNQITNFTQPLDVPFTGWRSVVYLDPIGNTFGTTASTDVVDYKITLKNNYAFKWTSWGFPPYFWPSRLYRKRYEISVELTLDFSTTAALNEYVRGFKWREQRRLRISETGPFLGVSGGTNYYKGFTLDLPVKWVGEATRDFTPGQDSTILKLKGVAYYDPTLGYDANLTWYSLFPSW